MTKLMIQGMISGVMTVGVLVALGGCSVAAVETGDDDDAPTAAMDGVEAQQIVYSADANGMWSANSLPVLWSNNRFEGETTFTGPAGYTRRMGACVLRQYQTSVNGPTVPCNTVADCNSAPASLPAGGFRYCVGPNGSSNKSCFYRPGPATTYCRGTPANGGIPIAPTTLGVTVSYAPNFSRWTMYGCFEGCTATDPSSSTVAQTVNGCQKCGNICCD
jgi:hypothetical protein